MTDLLRLLFPAERYEGSSVNAAGRRRPRHGETPVLPPWLLLATLSAAHDSGQGFPGDALGLEAAPSGHAGRGDPSAAAAKSQLRGSLQGRVAASLHSIDRVRELLRDPAGSARPISGGGMAAEDSVTDELDEVTAGVDPATILFEDTLRRWLDSARSSQSSSARDGNGMPAEAQREGGGSSSRGGKASSRDPEAVDERLGLNDGLSLAFRIEAAGETEAQVSWALGLSLLRRGCWNEDPLRMEITAGGTAADDWPVRRKPQATVTSISPGRDPALVIVTIGRPCSLVDGATVTLA